MHLTTN